jgi:hypothetical protein
MEFDRGDVPITLDGKQFVLRSTPKAMRLISQACGGQIGALSGLSEYRVDTAIVLISAGLNKTTNKEIDDINEMIFNSGGVSAIIDPLILYAQTVMNGGRPPVVEGDTEAGTESSESPQKSA